MTIARRHFLQGGALLALSTLMPKTLYAATAGGFEAAYDRIQSGVLGYFGSQGYRQVAAAPIATGDAGFNEGRRYDETGVLKATAEMVVQPCERVADRAEQDRTDVLKTFNIFGASSLPGANAGDRFVQMMGTLTGPVGLDPARLAFVSVPAFGELRPAVQKVGLDWDRQVILRDAEEARTAGDGSGHFRHPDPKVAFEAPSAGIHYWVGAGPVPDAETSYPLSKGWTEIGEFVLDPEPSATSFGLGMERLVLASTGQWPG